MESVKNWSRTPCACRYSRQENAGTLFGGWTLPLWKRLDLASWDDDIPNMWKPVPNHQPEHLPYNLLKVNATSLPINSRSSPDVHLYCMMKNWIFHAFHWWNPAFSIGKTSLFILLPVFRRENIIFHAFHQWTPAFSPTFRLRFCSVSAAWAACGQRGAAPRRSGAARWGTSEPPAANLRGRVL